MGLFWSHPLVLHNEATSKRDRESFDETEYKRHVKKYKGQGMKVFDTTTTGTTSEQRVSSEEVSDQQSVNNFRTVERNKNKNTMKRHKFAIVIGYLGASYQGMQRNPGARSIEGELEKALVTAGLIPNNLEGNLRKIDWSRAARTDKGVSAAGQVVSTYLVVNSENVDNMLREVNNNLPQDIRILGIYSVSGGFHAKNACDRRRYSYVLPCWVLCRNKQEHEDLLENSDYTSLMKQKIDNFNELLKYFIGTHHFHNFTVGQTSSDGTCQRYILEFYCSLPFFIGEERFLNVTVVGQSFLLHQIRKMIGLTIAVLKGMIPKEAFNVALSKHHRLETPMAPSLGLFLDECLFERYNERILKYHSHSPAVEELGTIRQRADQFKRQVIYEYIACQEREYHVMERWLRLVSTKHPIDVASIIGKYEELTNQEILVDKKRKEYMLDYISPMFDSSYIYCQDEVTFSGILDGRLNRCEEALGPKSILFYLRTPVEPVCIMGELTKSLQVPCVYLTSGRDIIWGVSVEDGDFSLSLYDSRSPLNSYWTMPSLDVEGCLDKTSACYYYFYSGWKVAAEHFQNNEILRKRISVVVDSVSDGTSGTEFAYYCSAFVIFMKLIRPTKSFSRQEIAEILIQKMNPSSSILSFDIYACLCARANHLLVVRPNLETQKVVMEHYFVPQWLFKQRMEWLKDYNVGIEDNNKYTQIKELWHDWLQKVRLVAALEMKRNNLSWISQSKNGIPLQAHSPGMLLWKCRRLNHLEEHKSSCDVYSIQHEKSNAREIAKMLDVSLEDFRFLFGDMDMESQFEWKCYLHEFMNQVNNIECFLSNWKEMLLKEEEKDTSLIEREALLERCLENCRNNQNLLQHWLSKLSCYCFRGTGCFQYCLESNTIVEWNKLTPGELDFVASDRVSIYPSNGICFWYPHFVRFVRSMKKPKKIRKSARKYRLR